MKLQEDECRELLKRVNRESMNAGLYLNASKTKLLVFKTDEKPDIKVNGENIQIVERFNFLGAFLHKDGKDDGEIRRRIAMGRSTVMSLKKIWKNHDVSLHTKKRLIHSLVFPVVLYGCETWAMSKDIKKKLDAFEIWCWRRVLRIPWVARKTNAYVLEKVGWPQNLQSKDEKHQLTYFSHITRRGEECLDYDGTYLEQGETRSTEAELGGWNPQPLRYERGGCDADGRRSG